MAHYHNARAAVGMEIPTGIFMDMAMGPDGYGDCDESP